ncbi:hypothetical protein V1478_001201 [Vespula squamosa]|uniref:Uncharacterized protein n=1 Tax=Vespula squamosa TaxID=30214 RepID=A0ABD2C7N4_VESSQ
MSQSSFTTNFIGGLETAKTLSANARASGKMVKIERKIQRRKQWVRGNRLEVGDTLSNKKTGSCTYHHRSSNLRLQERRRRGPESTESLDSSAKPVQSCEAYFGTVEFPQKGLNHSSRLRPIRIRKVYFNTGAPYCRCK